MKQIFMKLFSMKRIFLILFIFLIAFSLNAQTLKLLTTGDTTFGNTTMFTEVLKLLQKDFPAIKLDSNIIDLSTGASITMDAMLAAGTPPNLYIDTMVRTSKYIVPEFALALNGLVRDLDKYNPGILDPVTRGGKVLALPMAGGAQGMCINLDIMRDIGYTVPDNWTIDDFLKMAELVKQKYKGERWATGMFAGNQSGDYLLNNWFAAFGVKFYGGDYNKSIIADTGGAKVYKFYQDLVRAGYVPPNAATLNDDDYAAQWMVGKLAATAFFPSWTTGYFKSAMDQGLIKQPFAYKFVPFPRGPYVKSVPTYFSGAAMVGHKTGTDIDKVTARFMEYRNSAYLQGEEARYGNVMTNRIDVTFKPTDIRLLEVADIVARNGLQDVGLTDPRFTERRSMGYPILQRVLNLTITPEAAIAEYQTKLSSVK
jgi:ABC-type glycerol-3-phosphate transport system substrate-binding protein